jgi:hypothetical protein
VTAKRTDAHRPARDRFVHYLNAVTRREGWRSWEAIGHWLDASFRAMRGATLQHAPEKLAQNEAEYMRIVKRCREPQETMGDLSHMLHACINALEAEPIDFIGPIFSEFAASAQLGQFFTPHHLSMLMAGMTIDDPRKMLEQSKRGFITLQEPACGVGGMTLAACAVLREHGIDLARQVHWTLIDIDYAATCAAYVQVNLCGISADVFHGNTLSLETWLATPTLMAILHPKRLRYDPSAVLPASSPAERSAIKPVQLSLFADDKPAVAAARKRRSA